MTGDLERWIASVVIVASVWLQTIADGDQAWPSDGRVDDVTVLASLLIV